MVVSSSVTMVILGDLFLEIWLGNILRKEELEKNHGICIDHLNKKDYIYGSYRLIEGYKNNLTSKTGDEKPLVRDQKDRIIYMDILIVLIL